MTELARLDALFAAATPGEWSTPHYSDPNTDCECRYVLSEGCCGAIATVNVDNGMHIGEGGNDSPPPEQARANGALIAALHNAWPMLRDKLRELDAITALFDNATWYTPEGLWSKFGLHDRVRMAVAVCKYSEDEDDAAMKLAAAESREECLRMQAAACMTACLQNTRESAKERIGRDNTYWTQAYDDVCTAVDREMRERQRAEAAESSLAEMEGMREERDAARSRLTGAINALKMCQQRISPQLWPEYAKAVLLLDDAARAAREQGNG